MKELGIWIEVTTLVIPGVNDHPEELNDIANFIALELGHDTPWHLSRFFPHNKMPNVPHTPSETLQDARTIGFTAGLKYVYLGNMQGSSDTLCPACGEVLIQREGYVIGDVQITDSKCKFCGEPVSGVWD
jgi:pyruvate formate lyase activating enzyme